MAEFVLVLTMLLILFLGLLQVCLWAYCRTILTSAAAETARYAGLADVSDFDVTRRVREELGTGLGTTTTDTLQCSSRTVGLLVEVNCTLTSPGLIGLLDDVMPTVDVTGHAAREPAPTNG